MANAGQYLSESGSLLACAPSMLQGLLKGSATGQLFLQEKKFAAFSIEGAARNKDRIDAGSNFFWLILSGVVQLFWLGFLSLARS